MALNETAPVVAERRLVSARVFAPLAEITEARAYELARRRLVKTVRLGRQVRFVLPDALDDLVRTGGFAVDDATNERR